MGLTRRQLLAGGLTAIGAAAVARNPIESMLRSSPSPASSSAASPAAASSHDVLVLVTLYGGNDGLNTVIPAGDPAYAAGRGELAYTPDQVLALGDGLGLHPSLKALHARWAGKQVAIVRGVGYPSPNRSHFRSMDIWQSGVPDHAEGTGWLGRWLDHQPRDPLRAIAIGATVPLALRGEKTSASAVPTGSLQLPGSAALAGAYESMMRAGASGDSLLAAVATSGSDLLTVDRAVAHALASPDAEDQGGGTNLEGRAAGSLAPQLDLVARAIVAGLPTSVYGVSMGGFDNHANEKGTHADLLSDLDAAIESFFHAVGERPVTVLVHSEFGRRVAVNGSGGTDHGTAAPVFLVGPKVRAGFHGDEPSLTNLDDGDLRMTTDFRSVYAEVLRGVLGADPTVAVAAPRTSLQLF